MNDRRRERARDITAQLIVLVAAVARGDVDQAERIVRAVATEGGDRALYAMACGAASIFATDGRSDPDDGGSFGFAILDRDERRVEPEDVPAEMQPFIWASRFVTAHLNGDAAMKLALWSATDGDALFDGFAALMTLAGHVVAAAIEPEEKT